jgi:hypothetical protein
LQSEEPGSETFGERARFSLFRPLLSDFSFLVCERPFVSVHVLTPTGMPDEGDALAAFDAAINALDEAVDGDRGDEVEEI